MAGNDMAPQPDQALSERKRRYAEEVERLVGEGVENPRCELTREVSLEKDDAKSRADFVKLVQGLANAHLTEERFLVIGADKKERRFYPVANPGQFDQAKVTAILRRYLEPLPLIEVFDTMETAQDIPYVLVVLSARQPRPVVTIGEIKLTNKESGETSFLLRKSSVWIKVGTGLQEASSQDFESILEERIETEAESRARARLAYFREELVAGIQMGHTGAQRIPSRDLVYGSDETFRLYCQEILHAGSESLAAMLLELFRDILIEGWNELSAYDPDAVADPRAFLSDVDKFRTDIFLPALRRVVEFGLLLIKHEANEEWFRKTCDVLQDVFDSSHRLVRLGSIDSIQQPVSIDEYRGREMPALEAFIGFRTLTYYAIKRERYQYLRNPLKRRVRPVGSQPGVLRPILFWPLRIVTTGPEGPIALFWERRIKNVWAGYFRSHTDYVASACQLEFVLEFNSYLAVGEGGKEYKDWFEKNNHNLSLIYRSDIWRYRLGYSEPLAEKMIDAIYRGLDDRLIDCLLLDKTMLYGTLGKVEPVERIAVVGGYLRYLEKNQAAYMFDRNRFPFQITWSAKSKNAIEAYDKVEKSKTS